MAEQTARHVLVDLNEKHVLMLALETYLVMFPACVQLGLVQQFDQPTVKGAIEGFLEKLRQFETTEEEDILISLAKEQYEHGSDGDIEIDDSAIVSQGDDGAYIAGWVWVRYPEGWWEGEVEEEEPAPIEDPATAWTTLGMQQY